MFSGLVTSTNGKDIMKKINTFFDKTYVGFVQSGFQKCTVLNLPVRLFQLLSKNLDDNVKEEIIGHLESLEKKFQRYLPVLREEKSEWFFNDSSH